MVSLVGRSFVGGAIGGCIAFLCQVPQEEVDEAREVLVGMEEKKKVLNEV